MSNQIFVGTRKGLFHYKKGGDGWTLANVSFPGVPVPMLLPDPRDNTLYAALDHGHFGIKFHRSDDWGQNWDELDPPAYPPKPDDVPDVVNPMTNKVIPWSLELIWSLEPGGKDQEGLLWCGTIPGGLFKSEDRGETWSLVESLWNVPERARWFGGGYDSPGIHSICVNPNDNNDIALGVSCAGVWRTLDGGETWKQCAHGMRADFLPPDQALDPDGQDPHRVVRCPAQPDQFWTQHHCGIFRSTDDSKSWHEIENVKPASFGFAVAVHPEDPDTAWFVPAIKDEVRIPVDGKVVVNRTRDGGKTFETLRNGLPQEHAYDLTYRHALEVDSTGNQLAFGSTTGSLWASSDQGDSWQTLSQNLPPIYCVRFANSV